MEAAKNCIRYSIRTTKRERTALCQKAQLDESIKARLVSNGYLSGQLGQVLGHCAMHELYILQQTILLASHCWNRSRHLWQHVVDCVLVLGANNTNRDSTNTTTPRIRLLMVCLRLIHIEHRWVLGGILSGMSVQSITLGRRLHIPSINLVLRGEAYAADTNYLWRNLLGWWVFARLDPNQIQNIWRNSLGPRAVQSQDEGSSALVCFS